MQNLESAGFPEVQEPPEEPIKQAIKEIDKALEENCLPESVEFIKIRENYIRREAITMIRQVNHATIIHLTGETTILLSEKVESVLMAIWPDREIVITEPKIK